MIHMLHSAIGEGIIESLKDGQLQMTDSSVTAYIHSSFPDKSIIKFLCEFIGLKYDVDVCEMTAWLECLYEKGGKELEKK